MSGGDSLTVQLNLTPLRNWDKIMKTKSIDFEPSIVKDDGFLVAIAMPFDVVDKGGDSVQKGHLSNRWQV